jgi:hypothetical protein
VGKEEVGCVENAPLTARIDTDSISGKLSLVKSINSKILRYKGRPILLQGNMNFRLHSPQALKTAQVGGQDVATFKMEIVL